MAEIKWIKITTDIFEDEKIMIIETLPKGDSILIIWFKLLCFAGKQNNSGVFLLGEKMPYTDEMLSIIFRRKKDTIRLALKTFEQFGMIRIIDSVITIPSWGKHQNLDQLDNKKEYMRKYMNEYRKKQEDLSLCKANSKTNCKTNSKTNSKTNCKTNCKANSKTNVSSIDIDKEIEIEKEKEEEIKESERKVFTEPSSTKHKHGEYNNVLLTDEELEKLREEYSDCEERIDRLSGYIASTGKAYKSHFATIRNWAKSDREKEKTKKRVGPNGIVLSDEPSILDDLF